MPDMSIWICCGCGWSYPDHKDGCPAGCAGIGCSKSSATGSVWCEDHKPLAYDAVYPIVSGWYGAKG